VDARLGEIPFAGEEERLVGHALATADLLGQMAADDYLDKLPILYAEYAEAARHDGRYAEFTAECPAAEDLVRNTPTFWSRFVLPKLERDLGGLHRFLSEPYPDGPNEYVSRIAANLERIRQRRVSRNTHGSQAAQVLASSILESQSLSY
jgi:hypothetical protein